MGRLRYKVRALMIAVASSALVIAVAIDSSGRRSLAVGHAQSERNWRDSGDYWRNEVARYRAGNSRYITPGVPLIGNDEEAAHCDALATRFEEEAAYHGRMKWKYRVAMFAPWFPVPRDPHPPDWTDSVDGVVPTTAPDPADEGLLRKSHEDAADARDPEQGQEY
jgi:hypothetical protein